MMFSPISYDSFDFPALSRQIDQTTKISTRPFVQTTKVNAEGQPSPLTPAEEVLNCHLSAWDRRNVCWQ